MSHTRVECRYSALRESQSSPAPRRLFSALACFSQLKSDDSSDIFVHAGHTTSHHDTRHGDRTDRTPTPSDPRSRTLTAGGGTQDTQVGLT